MPVPSRLRLWHCAAVVLLATGAVYWNCLGNGLVDFDDAVGLSSAATAMGGTERLRLLFSWPQRPDLRSFLRTLTAFRPITTATKALDKALFGAEYSGHHLMNLLWHEFTAVAAMLVAAELLGAPPLGLAAALIFAVHPLQTESVAYLAGRRDVLSGFFSMASLLSWIRWRKHGRGWRLACAILLWALALFSKQSAVALPALWLIVDQSIVPNQRLSIPWALAGLGVCGVVLAGNLMPENIPVSWPSQWYRGSPICHWAVEPLVLCRILWLLVWPSQLNFDYSLQFFEPSLTKTLACAAFLLLIAAGAWRLRKRRPELFLGAAWLAASFAPMLPLFPTDHNNELFAEHWLYMPVFGFALFVAGWLKGLRHNAPKLAWCCFSALLAAYGLRSALRNRDYRDGITLWSRTIRTAPRCARARAVLGLIYLEKGDLASAEPHLRTSIALGSRDPRTYMNLAVLERMRGRFAEAEALLRQALLMPTAAQHLDRIYYNLAMGYWQQGRLEQARRLRQSLPPFPDTPASADLGGLIAEAAGDAREAEASFLTAMAKDPAHRAAQSHLAALYAGQGAPRLARRYHASP